MIVSARAFNYCPACSALVIHDGLPNRENLLRSLRKHKRFCGNEARLAQILESEEESEGESVTIDSVEFF